jgi:hypothetical protein
MVATARGGGSRLSFRIGNDPSMNNGIAANEAGTTAGGGFAPERRSVSAAFLFAGCIPAPPVAHAGAMSFLIRND